MRRCGSCRGRRRPSDVTAVAAQSFCTFRNLTLSKTRCGAGCWLRVRAVALALASSSRSQVQMPSASADSCLTWNRTSVGVRWRSSLAMAIVTHLVTQPRCTCLESLRAGRSERSSVPERPPSIRVWCFYESNSGVRSSNTHTS